MNVLITGSSGLIGSTLVPYLKSCGHEVSRLIRGKSSTQDPWWDPETGSIDVSSLTKIDSVIHLAGENVGNGLWTARKKARILTSRVKGTQLLSDTLARLTPPPQVLISASGIGFYGNQGEHVVHEDSPAGEGFLATVSQQWEEATGSAHDAGIRVVTLRLGMVLSLAGGVLKTMLFPFKMGLGGVVGNGRQYISWIGIDDVVAAIQHILVTESLTGPVNMVTPYPVTNYEFTKTLGRVLNRPTLVRMPACIPRLIFREMADELLLTSTRGEPQKLTASGYTFQYPTLEGTLRHLVGN